MNIAVVLSAALGLAPQDARELSQVLVTLTEPQGPKQALGPLLAVQSRLEDEKDRLLGGQVEALRLEATGLPSEKLFARALELAQTLTEAAPKDPVPRSRALLFRGLWAQAKDAREPETRANELEALAALRALAKASPKEPAVHDALGRLSRDEAERLRALGRCAALDPAGTTGCHRGLAAAKQAWARPGCDGKDLAALTLRAEQPGGAVVRFGDQRDAEVSAPLLTAQDIAWATADPKTEARCQLTLKAKAQERLERGQAEHLEKRWVVVVGEAALGAFDPPAFADHTIELLDERCASMCKKTRVRPLPR